MGVGVLWVGGEGSNRRRAARPAPRARGRRGAGPRLQPPPWAEPARLSPGGIPEARRRSGPKRGWGLGEPPGGRGRPPCRERGRALPAGP